MDPFKYFSLRRNHQRRNSNGLGAISACTSYFADVCLNQSIINLIYEAHKVDASITAQARQLIAKLTKRVHNELETNPRFADFRTLCRKIDKEEDFAVWVQGIRDAATEMRNLFFSSDAEFANTVMVPFNPEFTLAVEEMVFDELRKGCDCESCTSLGKRFGHLRAMAQQRN